MAAQLNYNYETAKAVAGAKVDLADDVVATRRNEEANGTIKYGMAVAVGSVEGKTVKKVATASDVIDGVVICHPNTEMDMEGNVIIKKDASLGIMKHGHIWGRLATGVTPTYGATAKVVASGDDAGCFTTGEGIEIGATFGNETDDGIAIIVLK